MKWSWEEIGWDFYRMLCALTLLACLMSLTLPWVRVGPLPAPAFYFLLAAKNIFAPLHGGASWISPLHFLYLYLILPFLWLGIAWRVWKQRQFLILGMMQWVLTLCHPAALLLLFEWKDLHHYIARGMILALSFSTLLWVLALTGLVRGDRVPPEGPEESSVVARTEEAHRERGSLFRS